MMFVNEPVSVDLDSFFSGRCTKVLKDIIDLTPEEAEDYDGGCYRVNGIEFHKKNCIHQQEKEKKEQDKMNKEFERYRRDLLNIYFTSVTRPT